MFSGVGGVSFVQVSGVCGFSGGSAFRGIPGVSQSLVPKFVPIAPGLDRRTRIDRRTVERVLLHL